MAAYESWRQRAKCDLLWETRLCGFLEHDNLIDLALQLTNAQADDPELRELHLQQFRADVDADAYHALTRLRRDNLEDICRSHNIPHTMGVKGNLATRILRYVRDSQDVLHDFPSTAQLKFMCGLHLKLGEAPTVQSYTSKARASQWITYAKTKLTQRAAQDAPNAVLRD